MLLTDPHGAWHVSDITLQMVELFPKLLSSSSTSAPNQFRQVFAYERLITNTLRDALAITGSCKDFMKEVVDGDDKYKVTEEGLNKISFYSIFSGAKSPQNLSSSSSPSPASASTSASASVNATVNTTVSRSNGSRTIFNNTTTHSTTTPAATATVSLPVNFYTGDDIQYPDNPRLAAGTKRKLSPVNVVLDSNASKRNGAHVIHKQRDEMNHERQCRAERGDGGGGGRERDGEKGGKGVKEEDNSKDWREMEVVDDDSKEQKKPAVSRELTSLAIAGLNDVIIPSRFKGLNKPVEQRDLKTGRFLRCYISLTAAAAASGICRKKIAACCAGFDNVTPFGWVYRKDSDISRIETGTVQ